MPTPLIAESIIAWSPDRAVILVDPASQVDTNMLADKAVYVAKQVMPKVTGHLVSTMTPISQEHFFGIYFPDKKVWFLERGIRPFTMSNLQGKVIPMWVEDPTGRERKANPKAKTRQTLDGRMQVLIFRRAALKGTRRNVTRTLPGGHTRVASVPASYPGAPGRIARREAAQPLTTAGRRGGRVARGNVGVKWRHPGTVGRNFLNYAMAMTAWQEGLDPDLVYFADGVTLFSLLRSVGGG